MNYNKTDDETTKNTTEPFPHVAGYVAQLCDMCSSSYSANALEWYFMILYSFHTEDRIA